MGKERDATCQLSWQGIKEQTLCDADSDAPKASGREEGGGADIKTSECST